MEVLTEAQDIKEKLQWIFEDTSCDRVVVVAFVGENSVEYLPNPEGIRLFCWPLVPGTNPNGLRKLVHKKVLVRGVDKLHSKIYWSENRGCIIGSANLSGNALEKSRNIETCVYLNSGEIDIASILEVIEPQSYLLTSEKILKLERVFNQYSLKNPPAYHSNTYVPSFAEWFEQNKGEVNIKIRYWDSSEEPPTDAVEHLKNQTGSEESFDFIHGSNKNTFHIGDWVLEIKETTNDDFIEVEELSWFIPEVYTRSSDKSWGYDEHIWFQTRESLITPPFDVGKDFLIVISDVLREFDDSSDTFLKYNKPKMSFLKSIYAGCVK